MSTVTDRDCSHRTHRGPFAYYADCVRRSCALGPGSRAGCSPATTTWWPPSAIPAVLGPVRPCSACCPRSARRVRAMLEVISRGCGD